mmetsp:Transcript_44008/g.58394  ORF Transcript_44008/g.58394 Transcript_44008/m.58394 type:complete len:95 (-) Transcript_44008:695-979(-)
MKSNLIQGIQERSSMVAKAGARMEDKNRQTVMYLEAIQKLSMFIVRKEKNEQGQAEPLNDSSSAILDPETVTNIKSLMDEHVFELLDKTEWRVI